MTSTLRNNCSPGPGFDYLNQPFKLNKRHQNLRLPNLKNVYFLLYHNYKANSVDSNKPFHLDLHCLQIEHFHFRPFMLKPFKYLALAEGVMKNSDPKRCIFLSHC